MGVQGIRWILEDNKIPMYAFHFRDWSDMLSRSYALCLLN